MLTRLTVTAAILGISTWWVGSAMADDSIQDKKLEQVAADAPAGGGGAAAPSGGGGSAPPYAALLKDTQEVTGLIPLHHKGDRLFAELSSNQYSSEYIVLISISRGIGRGMLLGGMPSGFGDDWVMQFRKVDDKVHIIRKNVRFKASKGNPEYEAVSRAYSDSVLFSLPIISKGPKGGDLVDLSRIFLSDLPQLGEALPGFAFAADRSTIGPIKGFTDNVELEVAATYGGSGRMELDEVPDTRGLTVHVHYSISKVPSSGYVPRMADDRVGYFLTVVKDHSKDGDDDQFIRYINRWDLRKAEPAAKMSPPKKPLVFWIENTVPYKYRKPIHDGILEWNKAFAKAGFIDAIEVRQQPENADWDPEDINYNTFRWIPTSDMFSAIGPSRVNPYTGQILDADILFAADSLNYMRDEFDTFTPEKVAALTGGSMESTRYSEPGQVGMFGHVGHAKHCLHGQGLARQLSLGSTILSIRAADGELSPEKKEEMVLQGLKDTTMHEVGHTLGLRHNFKASTFLSLEDINKPEKTRQIGSVGSVMDYNPANIAPKGVEQGDYFPTTLGPYDLWAIEYGYTTLSGGTAGEVSELQKIAARSGEPGLAYATDEDTESTSPDPNTNRHDLGKDPIEFAKMRAQLTEELMPSLVDRLVKDGDSYIKARRAFNILVAYRAQADFFVARSIGGLEISRSHKGDKDAKSPVSVIDPARQRESLNLVTERVFSEKPFEFPAELYNQLGSSHWRHWGTSRTTSPEFPIHHFVELWQDRVLSQLMSSSNLVRIHDSELRVPADQDAFTTAELLEGLTKSVFAEAHELKKGDYTNRQPAISTLRRNLQRNYLRRLSNLALGKESAPDDCQTVAYAQLADLQQRIDTLLKGKIKLDSYSDAHLRETSQRIAKVLDARLMISSP